MLDLIAAVGAAAKQQHQHPKDKRQQNGDQQPRQRRLRGAGRERALEIAQKRLEPLHRGPPKVPIQSPPRTAVPSRAAWRASTTLTLGGLVIPFKELR